MTLFWACSDLLIAKLFNHFINEACARESFSYLPFSSLACSRLMSALSGSVFSTHSKEPSLLVIGVTEKVFK